MTLYYIVGLIVFLSVAVIGYIFFVLKKESAGPNEVKIQPVVMNKPIFEPAQPQPEPFAAKEQEYSRRIEELENEIKGLSDKLLDQAQSSNKLSEPLLEENQKLREELTKQAEIYRRQFILAQEQMQEINKENNILKVSLEDKMANIATLEMHIAQSKEQIESDLVQARSMVEQLKTERDGFLTNREASLMSVQVLTREFEELKKNNEDLIAESNEARQDYQKLKELNQGLTEQSDMAQNELLKYRAQASGLEQICENYKIQLMGKT